LSLVVGIVLAFMPADRAPAAASCYNAWTTAYVRSEYGPLTYDGTPISTPEPIAAAGWDIPLGSTVSVEGVGTFRVADRGHLAPGQIDVAVWSRSEAFAITGVRNVCVVPPE
jgi:3D (Asp-Asp-Asp) domain-containing protein